MSIFLRSITFCFTVLVFQLLNAQSKKQAAVDTIIPQRLEIYDTIWGEVVHDPYRWMENRENDSLRRWIDYQNGEVKKLKDKTFKILKYKIGEYGSVGYSPYRKVGRYYIKRVLIHSGQPVVLYYTENLDESPSLLLDPADIDKTKRYGIEDYYISGDNSQLALQLDEDGSDWKVIKIFDIKSRKWLSDHITHVKYSNIIWYKDGFFYTGYKETDKKDAFHKQIKGRGLYYHKVGTNQSEDRLIYYSEKEDVFDFNISKKGNYLLLYQDQERHGIIYQTIAQAPLPLNDDILFKEFIFYKKDGIEVSVFGESEDRLLVYTNYKSPNGAIYSYDPKGLNQASVLVPQNETYLKEAWQFGNNILTSYMIGEDSYLVKYDINGKNPKSVKLRTGNILDNITGSQKDSIVVFSFSSFHDVTNFYTLNLNSFEIKEVSEIYTNFNKNIFTTNKVYYYSKDSTLIPMYLTYRKDLNLSQENPVLLYGYGGFGSSTEPFFDPTFIAFMQYGGILAVPQIRGGGDFPGWHDLGRKHNKQNTVDDFIAAAEYLIKEKYTSSEKIAIKGGSQGGLLVLSAMTQRPELFKAVVSNVGVSDMMRFHLYNIGYLYKNEYGTVEDSLDFRHLYAYSPLHNLRTDKNYPATFLTTGMNDDRVHPFHSFKMQAALQNLSGSKNPHFLLTSANQGHCGCSTFSDMVEWNAYIMAFIFKMLGMESNFKKYK